MNYYNNSEWINDIREQISDDKELLNNFNKHADVLNKYSKFTPEICFLSKTAGWPYNTLILKWINTSDNKLLTIHISIQDKQSMRSNDSIYLDISKLSDSDFPEQDIEIIQG